MSHPTAQEVFLAILRQIETHAAIMCRHYRNVHDREDFIQESVCVAWKWTARMLEQDKDARVPLRPRPERDPPRQGGAQVRGRQDRYAVPNSRRVFVLAKQQ